MKCVEKEIEQTKPSPEKHRMTRKREVNQKECDKKK
jgi:hypothetical protein